MRDRIATQEKLIELKDERIEIQEKIIKKYENMLDSILDTKIGGGAE